MTQENKDLLLNDLCARLPYGVKIETPIDCWSRDMDVCELKEIFKGDDGLFRIGDIGALLEYSKPYLFPLSSMTEEQLPYYITTLKYNKEVGEMIETLDTFDWLNKNHFDYRGLIDKGLAIDATGLNIY